MGWKLAEMGWDCVLRFQTIYTPSIRRLIRTASFLSLSRSYHPVLAVITVLLHRDPGYPFTI